MLAAALLLTASSCGAAQRLEVTTAPLNVDLGVAPRGPILLHIDDVRVAGGESAMLRLFVNTPHATAKTSMGDRGFLQDLYLVPSRSAKGGWSRGQNFVIPIPAEAARSGGISITIVPIEASAGGQMSAGGSVHVRFKRPYVTDGP